MAVGSCPPLAQESVFRYCIDRLLGEVRTGLPSYGTRVMLQLFIQSNPSTCTEATERVSRCRSSNRLLFMRRERLLGFSIVDILKRLLYLLTATHVVVNTRELTFKCVCCQSHIFRLNYFSNQVSVKFQRPYPCCGWGYHTQSSTHLPLL